MDKETERGLQTFRQWVTDTQPGGMVFFGGAGVSTESGIPDFRSPNGLYAQKYPHPPEQMISRSFFDAHPAEFFDFYCDRMLALDAAAEPGAPEAGRARRQAARFRAVVTQNIDGLRQKAGSERVLELHGSVLRNFCMGCGAAYPVERLLKLRARGRRRRAALPRVRRHREARRGAVRGTAGRAHAQRAPSRPSGAPTCWWWRARRSPCTRRPA